MADKTAPQSAFTNVFQLGIVVKDIDRATERLTSLGIGPFKERILPPREETFRGQPFDGVVKISCARAGDMEIELLQPVSGKSPHREFLEAKGEGIQHIACYVENIESHLERLTGQGVEVLLRARFPGGGGIAYVDLGFGLIVELVDRPPRRDK
jgi:catechol 2,3-dioxygenase-like lactoylglutathione lyase family enzyme